MSRKPNAEGAPGTISPSQPTPPGYAQPNPFPGGMYASNPFAVASPTGPAAGARGMPKGPELLHALKRRWFVALLVGGLVSCVCAVVVWMLMPSGKHQANATIQMKSTPAGMAVKFGPGENELFQNFKDEQLALMKNKTFHARVANNRELSKVPSVAALSLEDRIVLYGEPMIFKWVSPEFLSITMNGDNPEMLQSMLKAFVSTYIEEGQSIEKTRLAAEETAVRISLERIQQQIDQIEKKMEEEAKKGIGRDTKDEIQSQRLDLTHTQNILQKNEEEENVLKTNLGKIDSELKGEIRVEQDALTKRLQLDPRYQLAHDLVQLKRFERDKLKLSLLPGAARLIAAEEELVKAEKDLETTRAIVLPQVREEVVAARRSDLQIKRTEIVATLEAVQSLIRSNKVKIEHLNDSIRENGLGNFQLGNKYAELVPLKDTKTKLQLQKWAIESQIQSAESRLKLFEDATVNLNLNLKQKIFLSIAVGVISLVFILLFIAYIEWRNRRIDGVDQVVSDLGMRVIGTIPAFPSRASLKSGAANENQNWRFILNESVNSTRTMLLHAAKTQQMQVIMVTSAMQGEGKTSLSSQLATSMATAGLRTLILDCDLRNPSMQKLFDIPVAPGCSEILLQEIDVADALQATTVPNLWIIPAGQCNHRVIAALAQGHPLEGLFNRLRGQFDIIIVDTCPILPVADTLLVAQHVDGVVFSILQDVSQLPKVLLASERLTQLNIPLLGAVVNGIKPDIQAYGYNYVKQLPA
jgi:capsular exopolysaccharide synthesis family protein